jgi:hypothetical protein
MSLDREELTSELRSLRKGRGLMEHQLRRRVGRQLTYLCAIADPTDTALIRERVSSTVENLAQDLPPDLRLAVAAALAIAPGVQHRFLTERVDWLADQLSCDDRTARRRIDHGFDLLVESAMRHQSLRREQPPAGALGRWHLTEFHAVLRLDAKTPELTEHRTMVADEDGLDEVAVSFSLPRSAGDVSTEHGVKASIPYGGQITYTERLAEGHYRFGVRLSRTLNTGDAHRYAIQFQLPAGQVMSPHYAVVPLRTCPACDMVVRFDPDSLPRSVWLLDGVAPRVIDSNEPVGPLLDLDRGEIALRFERLAPGLGYGLAWHPAPSDARSGGVRS